MAVNFLKLHMFLFYASFTCVIIYMTVYIRSWTDATYGEVGLLMMSCALSAVLLKPLICSVADRRRNYKNCLLINLLVMEACTIPFALLPYQRQLLDSEPNLRLNWYLMATVYPIYFTALGTVITLDDVFIVHSCQHSTTGEDIGQYRYLGSLGPAVSAIGVALLENYTNLPYMSTPMLTSCLLLVFDIIIAGKLKNLTDVCHPNVNVNLEVNSSKLDMVIMDPNSPTRDSVCSTNLAVTTTTTNHHNQSDAGTATAATRGSRVSALEQLELLRQLNRYDNYNLCKYLAALVLFGAFAQIHYVFFLETLTRLLHERNLLALVFILTSLIQISCALGETSSLLWFSRWAIDVVGRDALLMLFLCLSAIRYAIYGFFMDQLNVWIIGLLDVQTGFLWGILYNLMVNTAASYLSLLDLLLDEDTRPTEIGFLQYLRELKGRHSTESIKFALRATLQSLFSGACEGLGFALGPLLGGYWLSLHDNSVLSLYQSVSAAHLVALVVMLGLEYGLIRSFFGVRSRTDAVRTLVASVLMGDQQTPIVHKT